MTDIPNIELEAKPMAVVPYFTLGIKPKAVVDSLTNHGLTNKQKPSLTLAPMLAADPEKVL